MRTPGEPFHDVMNTASGTPSPALDIGLVGLDGRPARLRDHLGDPLIVFVWASW